MEALETRVDDLKGGLERKQNEYSPRTTGVKPPIYHLGKRFQFRECLDEKLCTKKEFDRVEEHCLFA